MVQTSVAKLWNLIMMNLQMARASVRKTATLKIGAAASGTFTLQHTFPTRRHHETSWNDNDWRARSRLLNDYEDCYRIQV